MTWASAPVTEECGVGDAAQDGLGRRTDSTLIWSTAALSRSEFDRLRTVIEAQLGVRMPPAKLSMVESRLRPRLRALNLRTFGEYVDVVLNDVADGPEFAEFANLVTTHKTDFFREPGHFDFLVRDALPNLLRELGAGTQRRLSVWCAACSTGEEAYTLGIVLAEAAAQSPQLDFEILATDVSANVVRHAVRAVYTEDQVAHVPRRLRSKYLLQSKDRSRGLVRIAPQLRKMVSFRQQNLLDANYRLGKSIDVIFCRNVFIYFERKLQVEILERFWRHLVPGGYLFLGHTESVRGEGPPLTSVGNTTYRKTAR